MTEQSVVLYHIGENWQARKPLAQQRHVMEHIAFIAKETRSGIIATAGPFCGLNEMLSGTVVGVVVLNSNYAAAEALIQRDPAVAAGLLKPVVYPFFPFPQGRVSPQRSAG